MIADLLAFIESHRFLAALFIGPSLHFLTLCVICVLYIAPLSVLMAPLALMDWISHLLASRKRARRERPKPVYLDYGSGGMRDPLHPENKQP